MITGGIDAGSRAIKVVLYDHDQRRIVSCGIADQGLDQHGLARNLFERTLQQAGLDSGRVAAVVATGYGRNALDFADTTISEISCHACGVRHLAPDTRTVIDIGGQDSKIIRLDGEGRVRDFAMNDRCAAGSGRFLEVVAARLGTDLEGLGRLGGASERPAVISSTCVVFAETEIVGLLAQGVPVPDIAAGVQKSIALRVAALAGRGLEAPVYFTGGVALQAGMVRALERALAVPLQAVARAQFTGALGAALLATPRLHRPPSGA